VWDLIIKWYDGVIKGQFEMNGKEIDNRYKIVGKLKARQQIRRAQQPIEKANCSMNTNFEATWGGSFVRKAQQEIPGLPSTPAEREAAFSALLQSGSGLKRVAFAM